MKFTKKEILQAIKEEILTPGYFCAPLMLNTSCTVCAVGALFKRRLKHRRFFAINDTAENHTKYWSYDYGITKQYLIENKKWLSLLSCEYERMAQEMKKAKVKENLTKLVKKYFPESFEAKPSRKR